MIKTNTTRLFKILRPFYESGFAILIGLTGAMLILWISGHDPLSILRYGLYFSLFTKSGFLRTLSYATPLILTATTWAIGMKVGLFNIGAEGGIMMGAGATIAASIFALPPGLHHLVAIIFAMGAGILLALPIAFLKIKRNVHEVVSTIMLNWIAIFFLRFLVIGPLRDPISPRRAIRIPPSSRFPILVEGSTLTAAIIVAIAFSIIVYVFLWYTKTGQHIKAAGFNQNVARNAGINVPWMITLAFIIGGAAAGLAGCALTAGLPPLWTVSEKIDTLTGYGFEGIGVAMIGRNHPIGCIFAAVFFGALLTSQSYIQIFTGVQAETAKIITGIIIMVLALPEILRIIRRKRGRE